MKLNLRTYKQEETSPAQACCVPIFESQTSEANISAYHPIQAAGLLKRTALSMFTSSNNNNDNDNDNDNNGNNSNNGNRSSKKQQQHKYSCDKDNTDNADNHNQ
jgi:hypothetical protein